MSSKRRVFKEGDLIRLRSTGAVYKLLHENLGLCCGGGKGSPYADGGDDILPGHMMYIPQATEVPLSHLDNRSYWEYAEDPFVRFVKETLRNEASNGRNDIC